MELKWREAGRLSAEALGLGVELSKSGTKILDIATQVEDFMRQRGATVALPLVISIDNIACHFTPSRDCEIVLEKGQLVSLDTGACIDGYLGDNAVTVEIGNGNRHTELIKASEEALEAALEMVAPGVPIIKPAEVMSHIIADHGFKTIYTLTGHFVERGRVHVEPHIPSIPHPYFDLHSKGEFGEGMVGTFEPFASTGTGWVEDGGPSNLYELAGLYPKGGGRLETFLFDSYGRSGGFFTNRWLSSEFTDIDLKALDNVMSYQVSVEKDRNAFVGYTEKTFVVTSDGCEVLTKC